eukprot:5872716-Pyramimonas_sp.AAC.1
MDRGKRKSEKDIGWWHARCACHQLSQRQWVEPKLRATPPPMRMAMQGRPRLLLARLRRTATAPKIHG